jgi:predicted acylesterase/phospholipase RssA
MNPLTHIVVVLAVSLSTQIASVAAPSTNRYRANVHTNSERNAFQLKAAFTTFDSVTNAISSVAFTNTSELLKTLCEQSRLRRSDSLVRTNWRRPIDIDIALGTDYQVFRWLDSGRIDATFVCPAALQLFRFGKTNTAGLVRLDAILGTNAAVAFEPRLRSFAVGSSQLRPDPEADFQSFLQSLTNRASTAAYRVVAPSHLSAAGFLTPLGYAQKWFRLAFPGLVTSSATESNFWQHFFAHVEFSLGTSRPTAAPGTLVIEFSSDALVDPAADDAGWKIYSDTNYVTHAWLTNLFVARAAVAEQLLDAAAPKPSTLPNDSDAVVAGLLGNEPLRGFLDQQFSIPELVRLLRCDQEASGKDELTLVLPGGGVKAAYQSALVDHLYSTRLLGNSSNAPSPALVVKSIAGNSGGALLGFFVAALEPGDSRGLTNVLWGAPDNLVTDRDIFGFLDMPRWASFVACIWVFIITLRAASWLPGAWQRIKSFFLKSCSHARQSFVSLPGIEHLLRQPQVTPVRVHVGTEPIREPVSRFSGAPLQVSRPRAAEEDPPTSTAGPRHSLAMHYRVTMVGALFATPVLFQVVNGEHGREHIPAIEGGFYFFCLCLAMLVDNCLFPTPAALSRHKGTRKLSVPGETLRRWPPSLPALVAILGFVLAAVPVAVELLSRPTAADPSHATWVTHMIGKDKITIGGLILCFGMLVFWGGMIWRLHVQTDRCLFNAPGDYFYTVLLGILIIALTYGVLSGLNAAGIVTFLELTGPFWGWLVVITIAFSLVCFFLCKVNQCPSWLDKIPILPWLFQRFKVAMRFQLAKHQSGTLRLSRLVRMHWIFTFGFIFWNVVVAPALYGNSSALGYLERAYQRFTKQPYRLQTRYAAPANDLVANRERYFLFHPATDKNSSLATSLGNDARAQWSIYPFSPNSHMKDVVFASGSPFPIFAPHAVRSGTNTNWLVDGGFAHNVPLEAARDIGSRQVLLLNSSPMEQFHDHSPQTRRADDFAFGQLVRNLPRLLPFLFHRSQVADFLIREHMFIVSLSPAPHKEWPQLFDFRKAKVELLLQVAGEDTTKRIGRIETAGPPVFLVSVRMIREEPRPGSP